jgi:hypothetical protein
MEAVKMLVTGNQSHTKKGRVNVVAAHARRLIDSMVAEMILSLFQPYAELGQKKLALG